jgi:TonB-dependent heme/hemoglobin receptor
MTYELKDVNLKKQILTFCFILFGLFFFSIASHSQSVITNGKVTEEGTGQPVAGANIVINGTLKGTTTNADGLFTLKIGREDKDTVSFTVSALGFESQTVQLTTNHENFDIRLKNAPYIMSEVEVVSDKVSGSLKTSTLPSRIISNRKIIEQQAMNIPELLLLQSGISMAGAAYHSAPSIRGLARKRVLVMVDGVRVTSSRNVGTPGTFVNTAEIDQIDILKGPYSTLWGSDAMGGVINISTKDFEKPYYNDYVGGSLDVTYRSVNNAYNINLAVNGKAGKNIRYRLSGGYRDADNYKLPDGSELMNSYFKEQHFGARILFDITPNQSIKLHTYYSNGKSIGKPANDTLTNSIHEPDNHFIAGLNYEIKNIGGLLDKVEFNLTRHDYLLDVSVIKHKEEAYSDDDKLVNNNKELTSDDYSTQLDFYLLPHEKVTIIGGFDGFFRMNQTFNEHKIVRNYWTNSFIKEDNDTVLTNASQNSYGIFTQADFLLSKKWFFNGGIRWNYFTIIPGSDFEKREHSAFSGSAGVSFNPTRYFSMKLNAGRAFRVPDIKELYLTTETPGGKNIANPDLVPEKSRNIDFSAIYQKQNTKLALSLFYNQIDNMIILDWDNNTANRIGTFRNIGEGLLYGAEMDFYKRFDEKFCINTNITKIFGFDVAADDELKDVPPLIINMELKYRAFKKFKFAASGRFSAKQTEVAEDDFPNDAYFTANFSAQWQIMENLNASASISNIFNNTYREHYMFEWMRAPARSFNFGINYNF